LPKSISGALEGGSNPVDTYVIDVENLSYIQRGILIRLKTVGMVPYTELKPDDLTGNSFNYHLRHVLSQGLIEKAGDQQYRLTAKGRLLADNVSLETMKLKLRPTVGMVIILKSKVHGTLLYHSNRAPLRDLVGLPFGKIRLGDTLENTFARMLSKRGIGIERVDNVESLGMAAIRYLEDDQLVAHRIAAVWSASYDGPAITTATNHGKSFWQKDYDGALRVLPEVGALADWPVGHGTVEIYSSLS
jgi:hypothetical protein